MSVRYVPLTHNAGSNPATASTFIYKELKMPNYPSNDEDLSDVEQGITIVEPVAPEDLSQEIEQNNPGEIEFPPEVEEE